MDGYKSSFKELFDGVSKYVDGLTLQNQTLRQALSDLLNEDDIKELPSYALLSMTYKTYLEKTNLTEDSTINPKQVRAASNPSYDPLHAPPSARFGASKKTPAVNPRRPLVGVTSMAESLDAAAPEEKNQESTHYSSTMPDMDSCLLGAPVPAKPKVSVKAKETKSLKQEPLKVSPKDTETVYRVEIKGRTYLRYNSHFYDEETKMRVGDITEFKLGVESEPVELTELADYPGYYGDGTGEGTIYILLNGEVAQAVGTLSSDELALWS